MQVTVVVPSGKVVPEAGAQVIAPGSSDAGGVPSEPETVNVTFVPPEPSASTVRLPGGVRVRTGGVASTVQLAVAGVGSVLPAASVARTEKV